MRFVPTEKEAGFQEENKLTKTEEITRKLAIAMSFCGVFIFFFKLVFF